MLGMGIIPLVKEVFLKERESDSIKGVLGGTVKERNKVFFFPTGDSVKRDHCERLSDA